MELPFTLSHPERLGPARRNLYGVFPPGFDSNDERDFAALLDRSDEVLWWHRNPARRADSLALFRWNDGSPFYPDFVVGVRDRNTRDHIALVEVKGPRGWGDPTDLRKAEGPAHPSYGRCVFVGREKGGGFRQLRSDGARLQPYAAFEPTQLRWAD